MVLTPASSYDNTPGLCVPASPPLATMPINHQQHHHHPQMMQNSVPRGNTTIYSSRPPSGSSSPKPGAYHHQPHLAPQPRSRSPARSPARSRQRLTRDAVAKIGKDSRLARWERVLNFVREQRASAPPQQSAPTPGKIDRKRRAEEIAAIEARNHMLDAIDLEEQDRRSLWSGGSGGTNGVDEFVWSEDEDDDVLPMPQAPAPLKIFPEGYVGSSSGSGAHAADEGIFECEMQVDDDQLFSPLARVASPNTQTERKRQRAKSSLEEIAFQKMWGKRIVEEMPALCRESELEGGLGRLMGRRMSAAY